MTRLISNSTRSRRAASTDGGTGCPADWSSEVLAALLTELPGRAGPRPRVLQDAGGAGDGRRARPRQCPTRSWAPAGHARGRADRTPTVSDARGARDACTHLPAASADC